MFPHTEISSKDICAAHNSVRKIIFGGKCPNCGLNCGGTSCHQENNNDTDKRMLLSYAYAYWKQQASVRVAPRHTNFLMFSRINSTGITCCYSDMTLSRIEFKPTTDRPNIGYQPTARAKVSRCNIFFSNALDISYCILVCNNKSIKLNQLSKT